MSSLNRFFNIITAKPYCKNFTNIHYFIVKIESARQTCLKDKRSWYQTVINPKINNSQVVDLSKKSSWQA